MRTGTKLLVALLVLGFFVVGCGKDEPETPEGYTRADPAPAPAATKARLGVLLPLSGPDAPEGQAFLRGLKLGINALGTPVGLTEKALIVKDIGHAAAGGLGSALSLLQTEKPWVLLGLPDGQAVQKLSVELKRAGVPLLTCSTDELSLPVLESHVSRLTHPDSLETRALANYAFDEARARQAVIVADSNNAPSIEIANSFRAAFELKTGIIQTQLSYGPAVRAQQLVRMIAHEKPDLVFLALETASALDVIDEARKQGLTARIAGVGWFSPAGLGQPDADYTAVITTGRDYTEGASNAVLDHLKAERLAAGITVPMTDAELAGYDAVVVLVNALPQAKNPAELATAISRTSDLIGTRGQMSMGSGRLLAGAVRVLTVKKRSFKLDTMLTVDQILR